METMDDFKDELEASFRQIKEGDIITGTVIAVSEEEITLDLKYYAQGIIKVEDFSNDPDFAVLEQIHAGDEIEATVVKTDDGQGNIGNGGVLNAIWCLYQSWQWVKRTGAHLTDLRKTYQKAVRSVKRGTESQSKGVEY